MKNVIIDSHKYSIIDLNMDIIENEILAYSEETELIIVFNKTASKIWNIIDNAAGNQIEISFNEICDNIMKEYKIPETERNCIYSDVWEMFTNLVNKGILVLEE